MNSWPYMLDALADDARITAFNPGQSPPPVSTPTASGVLLETIRCRRAALISRAGRA